MHRVLALASLVFAVGCVAPAGDESFIIRQNLAAPESGTCAFTPSLGAPSLASGQINLRSRSPYLFGALLESRITAAAGKESLRTIFVNGADISLEIGPTVIVEGETATIDDSVETVEFRSLFSAPIAPNDGLTAAQFDVVPLITLFDLNSRFTPTQRATVQMVATITAFGDYYGEELESAPFRFPITACDDCVIGNLSTTGVVPSCTGFTLATVRQGNPCNVFQDGVVDCCDTGTDGLQCPAVAVTPDP